MSDRKRETTLSFLPIVPTDADIGRVFTCHASNEALPAGKETSVKLNVHHPPTVTLSLHPQAVLEGERVIFTCTATANPDILGFRREKHEGIFFRNGSGLNPGSRRPSLGFAVSKTPQVFPDVRRAVS
ncbi:UNVERIFIED_CONTAM: hypothetical protein FKN15_032925 [Acipenser sinensis]